MQAFARFSSSDGATDLINTSVKVSDKKLGEMGKRMNMKMNERNEWKR